MKLLPVRLEEREVGDSPAEEAVPPSYAAIHIELRGKVRISVEGHADTAAIRSVLEVLRR